MDVEKTIEFLLGQQAGFWTALEELRAETRQGFANMNQRFDQLLTIVGNIVDAQAAGNERLDRLAEAHLQLVEEQRRQAEAQRQQAEAQRRADERMDALIAIVNGLVRRDREREQ